QAGLARGPRFHLSALADQSDRVVAVRVPRGCARDARRALGASEAVAGAAHRSAVLSGHPLPRPRLLRRLSVPLLFRGRSLPVPGQPRNHCARGGRRRPAAGPVAAVAPPRRSGPVPGCSLDPGRPDLEPEPSLRGPRDALSRDHPGQSRLLDGLQQPFRSPDRPGAADEAIELARTALQLKPDYPEAHNNLALVLGSRGQVDEAISHYRRALELHPTYAEAHNNLGFALAGKG